MHCIRMSNGVFRNWMRGTILLFIKTCSGLLHGSLVRPTTSSNDRPRRKESYGFGDQVGAGSPEGTTNSPETALCSSKPRSTNLIKGFHAKAEILVLVVAD